jgi:deoxyribodipyrimidine photo-lyase
VTKLRINLIWFKRDLRVHDHQPLWLAQKTGLPAMAIYCYEPSVIHYPDFSGRHLTFINQSLVELSDHLRALNVSLQIFHAEVLTVLKRLTEQYDIQGVYAHQETGNHATFQRDLAVMSYLAESNIGFIECKQFAVVRKLKSRDTWTEHAKNILSGDPLPIPEHFNPLIMSENISVLTAPALGVSLDLPQKSHPYWYQRQLGGEKQAHKLLASFLAFRAQDYPHKLSSPVSAYAQCSRLSPYLSYGNLSMRSLLKKLTERQNTLKLEDDTSGFKKALSVFRERLYWHCHFIQKLEDEPGMEFLALSPNVDRLRLDYSIDHFEAWKAGETGFPMVDACMKALTETGWLNFRMRAMLCSFATYQLWIDWRPVAHHLAKLFVDYEPGIHYSQIQMQSGITGINAVRIYNPEKQKQEHDPEGHFCGYWLGATGLNRKPIVDLEQSTEAAKQKIFKARQSPEAKASAQKVFLKHGSRKKPPAHQLKRRKKKSLSSLVTQLDLFDDQKK